MTFGTSGVSPFLTQKGGLSHFACSATVASGLNWAPHHMPSFSLSML